jgi:hypothetical protein
MLSKTRAEGGGSCGRPELRDEAMPAVMSERKMRDADPRRLL